VQLRPAAREGPLVEELHVHRVVLEQGRARDHRDVVVAFGEDLREGVEADEPSLDRREPELSRSVELDAREVEIDRPVGRPNELLHDRVELLRLLEARAFAGGDVRQVEDGHGPLTRRTSSRTSSREPKTSGWPLGSIARRTVPFENFASQSE